MGEDAPDLPPLSGLGFPAGGLKGPGILQLDPGDYVDRLGVELGLPCVLYRLEDGPGSGGGGHGDLGPHYPQEATVVHVSMGNEDEVDFQRLTFPLEVFRPQVLPVEVGVQGDESQPPQVQNPRELRGLRYSSK